MTRVSILAVLAWRAALPVWAQLPVSRVLEGDLAPFRAEVARIEGSLPSAADKATVTYEMARTFAFAKQWPESVEWLRKAVAMRVGLDPSRESIFAELRGTREFEEILAMVREATPAVSHSRVAFRIAEGDLAPESLAYDAAGKQFYFGSLRKGKIVRCSGAGRCAPFVDGLGTVVGLKVRGDGLWVLSNSDNESALIRYGLGSAALGSGSVMRKYAVSGGGHSFNDLVFSAGGDVYLSDTRAGAVWRLAAGRAELERLPGQFRAANGIAVSENGELLYVSTFPDGVSVVDLKSLEVRALGHGGRHLENLCLAMIDGLYFHGGSLIAIQNGFMTPRVVRLALSRDLRGVDRFEVLERRNRLFDGVTTGVLVGDEFFYMANIQDDKKAGFDPIAVLKVRVR